MVEKKKDFEFTINLNSNELMTEEEVEQLLFNRLSEVISVKKIEILKGGIYAPTWIVGILTGFAGGLCGLLLLKFTASLF